MATTSGVRARPLCPFAMCDQLQGVLRVAQRTSKKVPATLRDWDLAAIPAFSEVGSPPGLCFSWGLQWHPLRIVPMFFHAELTT